MVAAIRRGQSQRAVARQYGVSLPTVQYWVHRAQGQRLDRTDWSDRPPVAHTIRRTDPAVEDLVLTVRQELKEHSILGEYGAVAIHRELLARGRADVEVMQRYTAGNRPVDLYIAYYARQHQGAELFSSKNRIVGGKQWARIAERNRDLVLDGRSLRAHESIIRSHHETRLVWKWYWVAGEFTSSPYYAKLLAAKTRLFGGPQDAAVIALSTDHDAHLPKAIHTLQDFLWYTSFLATLDSFSKGKRGAGGQEEAPP